MPIGCQAAIRQRKAEERLRLPTWLWLGLRIAGNGILGFFKRKIEKCTEDPKVQKIFKVQKSFQKQKKSHIDTKDDIQMKEAAFSGSFFFVRTERQDGNKERSVKKRLKLFIVGLGIVGLVCFLVFRGKEEVQEKEYEYSMDYVQIGELPELLEFYYYTAEEWKEKLDEEDFGEIVTYDTVAWILAQTGSTEYITYDTEEKTVSREKWNQIYKQLLDLLDEESEIIVSDEVILKKEGDTLICSCGSYQCDLEKLTLKPMTAMTFYTKEDRIIGVCSLESAYAALSNVYVTDAGEQKIKFLKRGDSYELELAMEETAEAKGHICDLIWENGVVSKVRIKKDTIQGNLIAMNDAAIEIEGYGEIERSKDLPVYKTYGTVEEKELSDIVIANMKAEYVVAGDCVEAILLSEPAQMGKIRVLLLAEDGGTYRKDLHIKANQQGQILKKEGASELSEGTLVHASELFAEEEANTIRIELSDEDGMLFLCDGSGKKLSNGYRGSFELRRYQEGFVVVNELPIEQYLCAVVPSEMPSSYEPEALKAQAICARSYAYIQLANGDYASFGAHVDDTTNYQVYNKQKRDKRTTNAVLDTAGIVLSYQGKTAEAYYFSTSAGVTGDGEAWNLKKEDGYGYLKNGLVKEGGGEIDLSSEESLAQFIAEPDEASYESRFPFFRWNAVGDYRAKEVQDQMANILSNRKNRSPEDIAYLDENGNPCETMKGFGGLKQIAVLKRSVSGVILQLGLSYEKGTVLVGNEYPIRALLGTGITELTLADGSKRDAALLPSAYVVCTPLEDGTYRMTGGGYGHGIGMSQNGAQSMALSGKSCEEILNFFFQGIELSNGDAA